MQFRVRQFVALASMFVLVILFTRCESEKGAGREWRATFDKVSELLDSLRYDSAEVLSYRAIELAEKKVGQNHPDYAWSLNLLGAVLRRWHNYDEAEQLFKRALAIMEDYYGLEYSSVAIIVSNLALNYQDKQEYIEAERLFKRALLIEEKVRGKDHLRVADRIVNLAWNYDRRTGTYVLGREYYRMFNDYVLYNESGKKFPFAYNFDRTKSLLDFYMYHYITSTSDQLYKRALVIREKRLPPDHPDFVQSLVSVARIHERNSEFEQAESLYVHVLSIEDNRLEPDKIRIRYRIYDLVSVLRSQKKYAEVELLYRRVLVTREEELGTDNHLLAGDLESLARILVLQEKYDSAESLYKRILELKESEFGQNNPLICPSLQSLATFYQKKGDYDQAETLFKRSLEILMTSPITNYEDVAFAFTYLRWFYLEQDREEADIWALIWWEIKYRRISDSINGSVFSYSR